MARTKKDIRASVKDLTEKHLVPPAKPDAEIWVETSDGGAWKTTLPMHMAKHMRYDRTLSLEDGTNGVDVEHSDLLNKLVRLDVETLARLHEQAHRDTCKNCGEPALAVHSGTSIRPVWAHESGTYVCGENGIPVRPSRLNTKYATVIVAMRVQLPDALAENATEEDVAAYMDEHYVSYMTDDQSDDPALANDPLEILDTEIHASNVSDNPIA